MAVLAREQDGRIIVDYGIGASWQPEDLSRLINEAKVFVQRIRVYLISVGFSVK